MVKRKNLEQYLNKLMKPDMFEDYTPNGLQVEGKEEIRSILTSPSISANIIDQAIQNQMDAILVHHGFFWKNKTNVITGIFKEKIKKLLDNNINLFAYHLPLDYLEKFGNNEPVLRHLGISQIKSFMQIGYIGSLKKEVGSDDFFRQLDEYYGTKGIHISKTGKIKKVAIVSGAGTSFFQNAIFEGIDAFISGEGTEWIYQLSIDHNVAYSAMGHYKSECIGPKLLGGHLQNKFGINHLFFEDKNPF